MNPYPSLDYVLVGEPDLTIRDLMDHFEGKIEERPPENFRLFDKHNPDYKPAIKADG
ncbi:unnamed protein product [marine sediment metagenome]|uniref:Uncharacterized protein n=1 Tax=marine sediment metagenome TaxID=412755 RepID=X0W8M6_9ZZZZ